MVDAPPEGRMTGAAKAALALLPSSILIYVTSFRSGALKLFLFGLAAGFGLIAAVGTLRHPNALAAARRRLMALAPLTAAASVYLVAVWVSALKTGLRGQAVPAWEASLVLPLLLFVLPTFIDSHRTLAFALRAFVAAGMAMIASAWVLLLARLLTGLPWGVTTANALRLEKKAIVESLGLPFILKGPFLHPNMLGLAATGVLAGLFILRAGELRRTRRRLYDASLLLCGATIVVSLSVIAAFAALLTWAGMTVFRKARWWDGSLRIAAVAGILFFNVAAASGWRLDALDSLPIRSWTRVELWNRAIESVRESPLWGIGRAEADRRAPFGMSAHNTWIETALVRGLPAMAASSLFLILLLFRLPRARDPLARGLLHLVLGAVFLQAFEVLPLGSLWIQNTDVLALALPFAALAGVGPAASRQIVKNSIQVG